MMADVFVSYSRDDRARARQLVQTLRSESLRVWWDEDLLSGQYFRKRLSEEIDRARCVVVLWSESSVESDWVLDEARLATKRDVFAQASVDGTRPPMGYGQRHWSDLSDWDGSSDSLAFRQVRDAINLLLFRVRVEPVRFVLVTGDRQAHPEMGPTVNLTFNLTNDSESAIDLDWLALSARSDDSGDLHLVPRLLFDSVGWEHVKVPSNWHIEIDPRSTAQLGMQFREPRADLPNVWPVEDHSFELFGWVNCDHNVDPPNLRTTFEGDIHWQSGEMERWRNADPSEWDRVGASDRAYGFPLLMKSVTIG
jgi:hypothetical protein